MQELATLLAELNNAPVYEPQLTQLLLQEIQRKAIEAGTKPQAFDTPFRHSDAASCQRRLGFKALGVPDSDPFDSGSTWVAWVGTMIHEHWQAAAEHRFGEGAVAELRVTSDIASGHLDLFVTTAEGQKICFELKTVNGFKFSKAIGVDKSHFRRLLPEGPDYKHIVQSALNASAAGADLMVIGYLGMESLSIKCAEVAGFSQLDRVMAEWTYEPEVFEAIAEAERDRMKMILANAELGILLSGSAVEKGNVIAIDPNANRPYWACTYCSHKSVCERLAPVSIDFGTKEAAQRAISDL